MTIDEICRNIELINDEFKKHLLPIMKEADGGVIVSSQVSQLVNVRNLYVALLHEIRNPQ